MDYTGLNLSNINAFWLFYNKQIFLADVGNHDWIKLLKTIFALPDLWVSIIEPIICIGHVNPMYLTSKLNLIFNGRKSDNTSELI